MSVCVCINACLHNGAGPSYLCEPSPKPLCLMISLVCGHTPQLVMHSVSPAALGRTKRWELRIDSESFIIEINPSNHHKQEDNVIITPQVSCFYFSICFLSFRQAETIWCIAYMCVLVLACCMWEGASTAQKIPLRGICISLLCYSRLSGTLVPTYLSMSVQAVENKLICFSFLSLSALSFICFLLSLSLYINLCLTHLFSQFLSSCHCYAFAKCNIFLHLCVCLSLVFMPWKSVLISYHGCFLELDTLSSCVWCKNNFPPLSYMLNRNNKSYRKQHRQINKKHDASESESTEWIKPSYTVCKPKSKCLLCSQLVS